MCGFSIFVGLLCVRADFVGGGQEFIVYDTAQIRMRYVLRLKFKYAY
jgi:hypothetical protein